jgi:hypothetical protein
MSSGEEIHTANRVARPAVASHGRADYDRINSLVSARSSTGQSSGLRRHPLPFPHLIPAIPTGYTSSNYPYLALSAGVKRVSKSREPDTLHP